MSEDIAEDIEALYPDLGLVMDSYEGGLKKSEKVEEGVCEGSWELLLSRVPLPKHFGQVFGTCWVVASGWGPIWQYQVLMDLVSPLSLSKLSQVVG